ncbi:hypothetical protein EXIGLDRAFT_779281 [Exidia glandulosa HHB12029]|uniref:DUF6532 domain-containing protein n=1 Tax=Exidia glandulosa HHB12029 TaxID=1314781 RepID=A0A165C538_EXIGL|nr:hypothetical protein EXIGLDRAFT_779281 [Exidia glandulosa HHB12029]
MPRGKSKKRAADEMDEPASTSTVNVKKLSKKQKDAMLAQLMREKKSTADAEKTKKRTKEKKAEEDAEREYQASLSVQAPPTKKSRTVSSARSAHTSSSSPIVTVATTTTTPKSQAPVRTRLRSVSAERDEDDEVRSVDGYESGNGVRYALDPSLPGVVPGDDELLNARKGRLPKGSAAPAAVSGVKEKAAKGTAAITIGAAQLLSSSTSKNKKTPLKPMSISSDNSSDSSSSESDASDGPTSDVGQHTPYKRSTPPPGKAVPALSALTPHSRTISDDARSNYTVFLATEEAFPEEKEALRQARCYWLAAADAAAAAAATASYGNEGSGDDDAQGYINRMSRYRKSRVYKNDMNAITAGVDSAFRGHIVNDAEGLVESQWQLEELNAERRKALVQKLLHHGAFTFADHNERKGHFGCPVVPRLLRKAFLTKEVKKGHALGLGANLHVFAEVPPALVAFLLTAIECILKRWETGTYNKRLHFTMAAFEPVYTRHLQALHQVENRAPRKLDEIRKEIWTTAIANTSIGSAIQVVDDDGGYMRPEDLDGLDADVAA